MASFTITNGDTQTIDETFADTIDNINIDDGVLNIQNPSDNGLVLSFAESAAITVNSFGQLNVLGKLIELGVSDGTLGQVIPDWQNADQIGAIWVEKSAGSDTYDKWVCINPPEITPMEFADFADNEETGQVFKWVNGNLTFTDTAGASSVPGNGCKIKVPNIILTTVGGFSDSGSAKFSYDGGGRISLVGCSFSDFKTNLRGMQKIAMNKVALFSNTYITYCNDIAIEDIGISPVTTTSTGLTVSYTAKAVLNDIVSASYGAAGIILSYAKNITGGNIKGYTLKRNSTTDSALWMKVVSDSNLDGVKAVGGRLFLDECSGNKVNDITSVDRPNLIESTSYSSPNIDLQTSPSNKLTNITIPENGGGAIAYIRSKNSPKCDFFGLEFNSSHANNVISLDTCFGTRFVGVRFDGYRSSTPFLLPSKNNDLLLQNIETDGSYSFLIEAVNTEVKGMAAESINTDFAGIENFFFAQIYKDSGLGELKFIMSRDTVGGYYTTLSGTPKWTNNSKLYLRTAGDSVEFTAPWKLKGVSLSDVAPVFTGIGYGDFAIEYAVNNGSGFAAYLPLTQSNLAAEVTDPVVGFNLKIKITAENSSSNACINNITLATADTRYVYPVDFELGRIVFDEIFVNDPDASFALLLSDTHGTSSSDIIEDGDGTQVTGMIDGRNFVDFSFDYLGNTQGGREPGQPVSMTLVVSGLTSAQTIYIDQIFVDEGVNVINARTEQELSYTEAL